jgi:ABC-type bacteriocin/lantibiotic exporter with double-glycine peptidase domain
VTRALGPLLLAVLLSVPFYPDKTDQCGPSALASVLAFWGRPAEPRELRREVYVPALRGTLPMDLLIAARARGLSAEMGEGGLDGLKRDLDAGRPVIAFVNQGFRFLPIGHFMVLTGYDEAKGGVFAHSGLKKDAFVPYPRFLKQWERAGRWSLVVGEKAS